MEQTTLKENTAAQREYLTKNLDQINAVVSAVLGAKVNLKVQEHTDWRGDTSFGLEDRHNFRSACGIMAKAFSEVNICSFGVWWQDNGVRIQFHFEYQHIKGGSNGACFCTIDVTNDFVTIVG